jgi:hypothetical protein
MLKFSVTLAASLWLSPLGVAASYTIFYDLSSEELETLDFGATELKSSLGAMGHIATIDDIIQDTGEDSKSFVFKLDSNSAEESYLIKSAGLRREATGGRVGLMYAALEFAENVRNDTFSSMVNGDREPFLEKRGLKMNIPLDARTPSYADFGTAAHENVRDVWDMDFWHAQLDRMALNRYNTYTLWTLNAFPSIVKVEGFEALALDGVMTSNIDLARANDKYDLRATQSYKVIAGDDYVASGRTDEELVAMGTLVPVNDWSIETKIKFWQDVMEYAYDRGIQIHLYTWNVYMWTELLQEGFPKSIDDADEANLPEHAKTREYYKASVKALLETYPRLAGIGVTAGENAWGFGEKNGAKVQFLRDTFGQAVLDHMNDPATERTAITYVQRLHESSLYESLNRELIENPKIQFDTSTKYMNAHLYGDPVTTSTESGNTRRNINAPNLDGKKVGKVWLNLRNDDMYNFRWADYDYTKTFFESVVREDNYSDVRGFHMGPDGYVMGRNYTSKDQARQLEMDKSWFRFMLWGRLGYDLNTPKSVFSHEAERRLAVSAAEIDQLIPVWERASEVIPAINLSYYRTNDFQFHPEVYGRSGRPWMELDEIARRGMDFENDGYDQLVRENRPAVADQLDEMADYIESELDVLQGVSGNKEYRETIADIEAFGLLARFYADQFRAAYAYGFDSKGNYRDFNDDANHALASQAGGPDAKAAAAHWREYAEAVSSRYKDQSLGRADTHHWQSVESLIFSDLQAMGVDTDTINPLPAITVTYPFASVNLPNIPRVMPQAERLEKLTIQISDDDAIDSAVLRVYGLEDTGAGKYQASFDLVDEGAGQYSWVFREDLMNGAYLFDIAATDAEGETKYTYFYAEIVDEDRPRP